MGKYRILKYKWLLVGILAAVVLILLCVRLFVGSTVDKKEMSVKKVSQKAVAEKVSLHDPMVFLGQNQRYYMVGSHMTEASSANLSTWKMLANGVSASNPMFNNLLDDKKDAFSYVGKNNQGGYSVWAPSVIYNRTMKKYVMYFCTTSSYIKSNLCMAVADQPQGPYTYQKTLLYSGFTRANVDKTDFYQVIRDKNKLTEYTRNGSFLNKKWPNCIDPAAFYDKDNQMWLVYGSWSGGIFLLKLDEKTGEVIHPDADANKQVDAYYGKRLLGGNHHAIEGPYIQYDTDTGYYYLFVSYGQLQANGGYQIRQYRSKNVEGPYVDEKNKTYQGEDAFEDYGVKMMGNYTLPSLPVSYMAPGGQSAFIGKDKKMYLVYHQRFNDGTENHEPRIHQLFANEEGWLVAAPFETKDTDAVKPDHSYKNLAGTFYIVNHGTDVSAAIHSGKAYTFSTGGIIHGKKTGSYKIKDNTGYITLKIGKDVYKGVLFKMKDEAQNETICFSATGNNNETIWGVHYIR